MIHEEIVYLFNSAEKSVIRINVSKQKVKTVNKNHENVHSDE
jgi:hypothetical protein